MGLHLQKAHGFISVILFPLGPSASSEYLPKAGDIRSYCPQFDLSYNPKTGHGIAVKPSVLPELLQELPF